MFQQILFGVIRHGLTAFGGALVTRGLIDNTGLETLVGAIMAILGVLWSATHKIQNESVEVGERQNFLGKALLAFLLPALLLTGATRLAAAETAPSQSRWLISSASELPPTEQFTVNWAFSSLTNWLTAIQNIDIVGGMAAHFNEPTVFVPTGGQDFNLVEFGKSWRFKLAALHQDSWFNGTVEDEWGASLALFKISSEVPMLENVKPKGWLETRNFNVRLSVYTSSTSLGNLHFESSTAGFAFGGSFDIGK